MPATFYTDGSCDHKSRLGGAGWVRVLTRSKLVLRAGSHPYSDTTVNRMELRAIIHALESLNRPSTVRIYSDSLITVRIASRFQSRNVTAAWLAGLANLDLWNLYQQVAQPHTISYTHVRGHQGIRFNEVADHLAGRAYQQAKTLDPLSIQDKKEQKMDAHLGGRPSRTLFSA